MEPLYNIRHMPRTFFVKLCVSLRLSSPTLQNSYLPEAEATKRPQKRRGKMPHVRRTRRFPHRVLTNGHGVRHPVHKGWWGTGWFLTGLTGFAGLTGLRGTAEGTRKTRKSRGERGGETGNSDWWQGYANAPPIILASVTFGDLKLGRHNHQTALT